MKKTIIAISIAILIAVIISIRPLCVQYHLYEYRKYSDDIRFGNTEVGAEQFADSAQASSYHVMQLVKLGYLKQFEIPIKSLRTDAETITGLLLTSFMVHKTPAGAQVEIEGENACLVVVDKLENRHWWEMVVRKYLEK